MDSDAIKKMVSFATQTNSANGVRNMVSLARSESGIPIEIKNLDKDPMLLNLVNGTLDLRTGKLKQHCREDFLTKLAPVTFDTDANCTRWDQFLAQIFADNEELIGYVQRLVGYSLTGNTEEHILPFLYGTGANGKSTFVEVVFKLLGPDYSMKAPPELLLAKRGESHPTERADLHGNRFVACTETEDGRRLAESLVKEMTGGDRIRARRMREDFWEFSPTHHIWIAGNHKPVIKGTDLGIWRRVKLIPFNVTIPDAKQDRKLLSKLVAELSGILNWAVMGCLEWQQGGLQEPGIVRVSTKEYSSEMDDLGEFIAEHCEEDPFFEAPATELFHLYQKNGGTTSQQGFGTYLRSRGFESGHMTKGPHKGRKTWKGLRSRTRGQTNA